MKTHKLFVTVIVSWFIFLCFLNYFSLRPLWLDENYVLENIKFLKFGQILGPLENFQEFPRIYLMSIKAFSQKFNYSILSLRFFPLISMILAFFSWLKVYKKEFPNKWHFLLVLFSFTSSYRLSYYASEFKHYSMDVLIIGLFCLYLMYQKENIDKKPSKSFVITTLLLPLSILFSYSSFFVFWIVAYNFLFIIKKNSKVIPLITAYSLLCSIFAIFVFFFDLKHTLTFHGLFSYWTDYFICTDSFYCFIKSFGEGLRKMVVWWYGNNDFFRRVVSSLIPFFIFSIFGYGINSIRKYKFRLFNLGAIGLIIFLELFILGILKKYPFTGARTSLFFAPFVLYFITKGLHFLKKKRVFYFSFNVFYIIFLLMCSLNTFLTYLKLYD